MSNAIIIVAGGKGLRMGGDVPKQFVPVGGRPVLMRTVERFLEFDPTMQVVLVLPESQQEFWQALCREHRFTHDITIATGGATRFHSVKNGLAAVDAAVKLVGVHDGVRPFVSVDTIGRCYAAAEKAKAVVPVTEVVETLRRLAPAAESQGTVTVPRSDYRLVQTPQVFDAALLRKAYEQPFTELFTDDASVVEAFGHSIALVDGNRENIKLTTPFDLIVAEALCTRSVKNVHTAG